MSDRLEKLTEGDEGMVGKDIDEVENGDDGLDSERENATERFEGSSGGKTGRNEEMVENTSMKSGGAKTEADQTWTEENDNDETDEKITWTHHFVIAGTDDGDDTYSKAIREQRKKLICHVCGVKDSKHGTLRIPIQCIAGDEKEFKDWKRRHFELNINPSETECSVAMHVGCSRWKTDHEAIIGGKVKRIPLCYFYPGENISYIFLYLLCHIPNEIKPHLLHNITRCTGRRYC